MPMYFSAADELIYELDSITQKLITLLKLTIMVAQIMLIVVFFMSVGMYLCHMSNASDVLYIIKGCVINGIISCGCSKFINWYSKKTDPTLSDFVELEDLKDLENQSTYEPMQIV
jgi:hypothetical protein